MNTLDFDPDNYPGDNWLEILFDKHKILVDKYLSYEGGVENFDINTFEDQSLLKNYLEVRFIEELCEALDDKHNKEHFLEELTDALNFLIAAYYIYGIQPADLSFEVFEPQKNDLDFLELIKETGMVCNCLKNRPWRHSQYLVDLYVFEKRFIKLWQHLYSIFRNRGFTDKDIYQQWSLKYKVNLFRIETNY